MDVSAVGPFTNVECPSCHSHTRVKRDFGPYTLVRRHAIGGMSMVFVARDTTLDREVVVKILSEEFSADEKRIGAFEEEARTTASISHPHVVRVLTTGHAFGRFFIGMEFVTGGHFEHHIRERGTIPEMEALPLAIQVAEGLKAAKAAGLIHRDVKPGNILLDASGSAKLVDFGLALVTKGGKAKAEEIWATPYYVPPETIEGQEEDFRSDIYAFGATFYHALAGIPPCSEESMDTKRLREAKQHIKPLREVAPQVTPETCAVIDRCMAYLPDGRYRSYADLISDLKLALQHAPGAALAQAAEQAKPQKKRSRKASKLPIFLGSGAVIAALVAAAVMIGGEDKDDPIAPMGEATAPPAIDAANAATESGGLEVAGLYREAASALQEGDFERARSLYSQVRDHPQVLEPTASWSACEAVAAAWMNGESAAARGEVKQAIDHIDSAPKLQGGVRSTLLKGLRALGGFRPVAIEDGEPGSDAELLIIWLKALRNWEQGMPEAAEPGFRVVAEAAKSGNRPWLKPHALWAGNYLADWKTLRQAEPASFSVEPEKAREIANELDAILAQLRTRGRARFNVRAWQIELERAARQAPSRPDARDDEEMLSPGSLPNGLMTHVAACEFIEAIEQLKAWKATTPECTEQKEGLLRMLQSSLALLAELGEQVDATPVAMSSRDGDVFTEVISGSAAGLKLKNAAGEEVELGWGEIDPDSVIELHRTLARGGSGTVDGLRRHEQAIAFDLLVGDVDRAKAAGDRLAQVSEAFKRRWQGMPGWVPR
ncbi:MAG: serine/threonine protein kinase [Akkermansiaceae bacterium]|jgi:tRNA A-37 threonylcarbamoyl transferase component Bud32|nr:serine/threonine protein kinase [Akkermansiaceae bacterium]